MMARRTPLLFNYTSYTNHVSQFAYEALKFSYFIPYGRPQECDIYGPLCQTGSITVTKNLTNATTATVLPCSSYLTLQSYYLEAPIDEALHDAAAFAFEYADDWFTSLGRSPQCTSLAQAYSSERVSISNCGNRSTVIQTHLSPMMEHGLDPGEISSLQQPPGVYQRFDMNYWGTCCRNCTLDISEVRLYYFPINIISDCFSRGTFSSTLSSGRNIEKGIESTVTNIAVVSGNTLFVRILLLRRPLAILTLTAVLLHRYISRCSEQDDSATSVQMSILF